MQAFIRRILGPTLAVVTLSVTATAAGAFTGQAKPQLAVEAERSPQGARITFKGKNWPAAARVKTVGVFRTPNSGPVGAVAAGAAAFEPKR